VFTWPDGRRYEGEFADGFRDGRGASSKIQSTPVKTRRFGVEFDRGTVETVETW
jgi:hypothetical protein